MAISSQVNVRELRETFRRILLLNDAIGGGVSSQDDVPESLRREVGTRETARTGRGGCLDRIEPGRYSKC
jgi:hypothetical protein